MSPLRILKKIGATTWDNRMAKASPAMNELVTRWISENSEKFRCVESTWNGRHTFSEIWGKILTAVKRLVP
jgi:hypothetical protein